MTSTAKDETGLHRPRKALGLFNVSHDASISLPTYTYLIRDLFLFLSGEVDKMIVLCADQEWNSRLVEAASLSVPFLDRV